METLKSRFEFERVYTRGEKSVRAALVLFYLKSPPPDRLPTQRNAFVASRKVGGAVQRNRAKRIMRAAFSEVEAEQEMPVGWLVLIARGAILKMKSHQVAEQLREMLLLIEDE